MGDNEIRIAVDAMGSDMGPEEVIAGVSMFLKEYKDPVKIILAGIESEIAPIAQKNGIGDLVEFLDAPEVVSMEDKPMLTLKRKKNSSMHMAIDYLKEKKANALLSCGNTGALMAGGTLKLRPMKGVERPALGSVIPSKDRRFIMIDVGANPNPRELHYLSNAVLGANYAKIALKIENPKVGLLTIGTEEGKGNEIVQKAHEILKKTAPLIDLNYAGPVEGFQVFGGDCDVIVCDGFTGNILLKSCEGLLKTLGSLLKEELTKNIFRKIGAAVCMGAFKAMKARIPVEKVSGAPLLGLNELIIKGHGSSNRHQICGALNVCAQCVKNSLIDSIKQDIDSISKILNPNSDD